jgi:VWFA-related protein
LSHSAESPSNAAPTIQVYSREIAVDVLVTDDRGAPVYGLSPSDFTIEENGKPQSLRSFREFGTPAATPALPTRDAAKSRTARALPANVYTNFEATPAFGPVNIILLDTLSAGPPLVDYAEEQINEYIRTMPAGTQMAIFWLSGSGLHMLQGFASDRDLLLKATQTNRTDFGVNDTGYTRRRMTVDALNQIAAYVSGIKGRKNLLWFTPHMGATLVRDGGYSWGNGTNLDRRMNDRIMDTYDVYTAEQIAVCPIDPHGVRALGETQLQMIAMAEQTGGVAYYNSNDLRAGIAKAIADGSHSYSLSYVPPEYKNDGHFHKISVKVDRPGLHLVYRSGYNAELPAPHDAPVGSALLTASLEGKAPAATQVLFDARVEPGATPAAAPVPASLPASTPLKLVPYDFLFAVPQDQVAFVDGPNGTHTGTLKFAITAYDIDGKLVSRLNQTVHLDLNDDQYRQFLTQPLRYHQQLSLPGGQLAVRLGVLDGVSNKVGTMEISLFNYQTKAQADLAKTVIRLHGK